MHPWTHEPMHPCTHAPMHPCTHAPMHPCTQCTHARMHPCTHGPMQPCTHGPMHPCTQCTHAPMGVRMNFSRVVTMSKSCLSFSGCYDTIQTDIHKVLDHFYPIHLCQLNLNSQSFVSKFFYTSAIRNAFSFHEPPNIPFFKHFSQISHN